MTKYDNFKKYIDDNNYTIIQKDQLNVIDITKNQNVFAKFEIIKKNKNTNKQKKNKNKKKKKIHTLFTINTNDITEETIQQICNLINQDQQTINIQQNKAKQIW